MLEENKDTILKQENGGEKLEAASVSLRHFRDVEREYILDCLMVELGATTIADYFMDLFPEFGADLLPEVVRERLRQRIDKIKHTKMDEIENRKSEYDLADVAVQTVPAIHAKFRIHILYRLLLKTPSERLTHIKEDSSGELYEIYKENAQMILKILDACRAEEARYRGDPDMIPEVGAGEVPEIWGDLTDKKGAV